MTTPTVTCLCPTYGRLECLRDALACFLLQDYPGKRLLIMNDAAIPIYCDGLEEVLVINVAARMQTLGHKRQALLKCAQTDGVAHWDDDDLYLPWHLSSLTERLMGAGTGLPDGRDILERGAAAAPDPSGTSHREVGAPPGRDMPAMCVKPATAWYATGPRDALQLRGIHRNTFEGQMLFHRQEALDIGGYPPRDSGQAADLLCAFRTVGRLDVWEPEPARISYVYRWGRPGISNVSARAGRPNDDNDFGFADPLIPEGADPLAWAKARLAPQMQQLAAAIREEHPKAAARIEEHTT